MTDNTEYKTVSGYTEYQIATGNMEYHTGTSTNAKTKLPVLSFGDNRPKPLASGTQGKITMESSLSLKTEEEETPKGDTPKQALAEAITTRMPEGAIAIAVLQAIDDVEPSEVKTHLVLGNSFFLGFWKGTLMKHYHWVMTIKTWTSTLVCRGRQTMARGGWNVQQLSGNLPKIRSITQKKNGRPGRYF